MDVMRAKVMPLVAIGLAVYVAFVWLLFAYGRAGEASLLVQFPLAAAVGWCGGYVWSATRRRWR